MMAAATHPLDDLLYHQQDLTRICAERPLDWEEYAHMNEFHGNAGTLKRYAGLPLDEPLPFAVEHAIPYDLKKAYSYDLNCALPTFLAVHEASAQLYRDGGMEHVEPIGFSHLYAIKLFERLHPDETERERRGTIVFPDKSTLLMDTDFDRATFAKRLRDLPEEFQPVVVCIYWRDFLRGQHRPFEEAGLPVVSAGHLRDPDFPLRLHDLCRRFRWSCANDLAGSFVASILSGCHFFHLPTTGLIQQKYGITSRYDRDPTLAQPHKAACIEASPFPPQSADAQRALAHAHAGIGFLKTPKELLAIAEAARSRLVKDLVPGELKLDQHTSPEGLQMLHRLLPSGIDRDGWARRHARLRVAHGRGVAALRLKLAFMKDPLAANQVTEILLNGRRMLVHRPPPYGPAFIIKLDERLAENVIEFHSKDEIPLTGEPRQRSFRVACVELLDAPALAALPGGNAKKAKTKIKSPVACPSTPPPRSWFSRLAGFFQRNPGRVKCSTNHSKSPTSS